MFSQEISRDLSPCPRQTQNFLNVPIMLSNVVKKTGSLISMREIEQVCSPLGFSLKKVSDSTDKTEE